MTEIKVNALDYNIVRASLRAHIRNAGGLSTLTTDSLITLVNAVTMEIEREAKEYPSFQAYWQDTDI